MRRLWSWLSVLLFLAAGALAWFPYQTNQLQDLLRVRPFQTATFTSADAFSGVASDGKNVYLTVMKKAVYVMDATEHVQHVIRIQNGPSDRINDVDGVTGDAHGNTYVLVTTLDPQGMYVLDETINEYNKQGQFVKAIFHRKPPNAIFREGDVRSMHVIGPKLWFTYLGPHDVQVMNLDLGDGQVSTAMTYHVPSQSIIANASSTGDATATTYITTMSGTVFRGNGGTLRRLYRAPTSGGYASKMPRSSLDGSTVYLVDAYHPQLLAMNGATGAVHTMFTESSAQKATGGQIDLADFQGLTTAGPNLIGVTSDHLWVFTPSGAVLKVSVSFPFTDTMLKSKAMFVTGLAFMLACCLYWLTLLARYVIKRRRPLLLMSLLIFVPAFVIAMYALNLKVHQVVTATGKANTISELRLLAYHGEKTIPGDDLQALQGPGSVDGPHYQHLLQVLSGIYADSGGVSPFYSTLYLYRNHDLYIIHDDDSKVQPFTEFPLDWNPVQDGQVLFHGQIVTEPNPDPSPQGYWMYALAPVYNSAHHVVGIYETGMDESVIVNQNRALFMKLAKPLVIIFAAIFLLVILANLWLNRLVRRLRIGAMAIANGKWGSVVRIRSKNEFQDLADSFNVMSRRLKETFEQVRGLSQIYYRFVPDKFIQFIGRESIGDVQLGDQAERDMTVLVCHIRDFYRLSNQHSSTELFAMMNGFLGDVGPIVGDSQINGFISRYLGSGFLALFPEGPETALAAGLRILAKIRQHPEISVGVGLHYGSVMLGVLGDAVRWEGSVLSEDVNLAQMVEDASGVLGSSMLVTGDMLAQIRQGTDVQVRNLGRIYFAPLGRSVHLYDVLDGENEEMRSLKLATRATFEEGVMHFQEGKFHMAREAFVRVIRENGADEAARLYFYAADQWRYKGVGNDWTGDLTLVDFASNF